MMHVDQKVALQVGEQVPLVEKHLEAMIVRLLEDLLLGHGLDGIPLVFANTGKEGLFSRNSFTGHIPSELGNCEEMTSYFAVTVNWARG